jgi:multicomponent Na+:H+ antiporter subunit D
LISFISCFLILPLIAASLCYALERHLLKQLGVSLISFFTQFSLALYLLINQDHPLILSFGGWPADLAISFYLDPLAALLVAVSSLVFFSGSLFVFAEKTKNALKGRHTFTLLSMLQLGMNGAFLTADLFNLFVFFEVLLISALVLIVSESREASRRGALVYLSMNFLASAIFLFAIGFIYQQTGALSFELLREKFESMERHWKLLCAGLLLCSFATKAGLFPLYFWLPRTYPFLSGAVGGIFGGLLTKVGLYAILRLSFVIFPNGDKAFDWLLIISVLSMILGVFAAFSQKEIRSILSFHIISQVGYIGGGIALAGLSTDPQIRSLALAATIFYFIHHILVKSNLFFGASWMSSLFKSSDVAEIGGLMHKLPLLSFLFAVPAMSLAGIPPFSGFWAKLGVIQAAFFIENWLYIVAALLAGLFTFLSMLKIWQACFMGEEIKPMRPISKKWERLWCFGAGFLVFFTLILSLYPFGLYQFCLKAAESIIHWNLSVKGAL